MTNSYWRESQSFFDPSAPWTEISWRESQQHGEGGHKEFGIVKSIGSTKLEREGRRNEGNRTELWPQINGTNPTQTNLAMNEKMDGLPHPTQKLEPPTTNKEIVIRSKLFCDWIKFCVGQYRYENSERIQLSIVDQLGLIWRLVRWINTDGDQTVLWLGRNVWEWCSLEETWVLLIKK